MGASIWIKAIRGYLHFLCGSWALFDMRQESRHHPPQPGQLRWRVTRGTAKEEQPVGQSSCQALLSHAVMDARVGAGSWPTFLEVLLQLMGHDEAGALVQFFCPRGVSECQRAWAAAHFWCQLPTIYNCPATLVHTCMRKAIKVTYRYIAKKNGDEKRAISPFFYSTSIHE